MAENDFKKYSVILGAGSGVLFRPLDENIIYILSAKHVFYDKFPNTRGTDENRLLPKINYSFSNNQNTSTEIEVKLEQNYFEHQDTDAAILILNENLGINQIFVDEKCNFFNECFLCGYPSKIEDNNNDRYTNYQINRKIDNTNTGYFRLETNFGNLNHEDVIGFSGGGIFRLNNGVINIIGIQSSTITDYANGQIDVVPINKFLEIVEENNLSEMIPMHLSNFSFLENKIFDFNAGSGEKDIAFVKTILKRKALEVIKSEITPAFIKGHFKEKLLLNNNDLSTLKDEKIYITWLEFLTFLNIIKSKIFTQVELIDSQSIFRLIFNLNETEWLGENFVTDCLSYDYENLSENGTVFIKTKNNPSKINDYSIKKGSIVPSISAIKRKYLNGDSIYNGLGVDIFDAESESKEFIFDKYNFVHYEYLKYIMLVENSDEYRGFNRLNESELLIKLQQEYAKIFRIQ